MKIAAIFLTCQSILLGQAIDMEAKIPLKYDGKSEEEVTIESPLIYGFTYKVPVELRVGEGVILNELTGRTICQCASLQFSQKNITSADQIVTGQVLLKPKHADLMQILGAFGTRPNELEPTRIGRIKVNCKVYSPVNVEPSMVEIKDRKFAVSAIELRISNGVEIIKANISDSNGLIKGVFVQDKNQFLLEAISIPLQDDQGELTADFTVKYKNTEAAYSVSIPYAPKPATRVIPGVVAFGTVGDLCVGRLAVIGLDNSVKHSPSLMLEKVSGDGTWERTGFQFEIDHFEHGKAFGRFVLPSNQSLVAADVRSKMRLTDKITNSVVVEFESVLNK